MNRVDTLSPAVRKVLAVAVLIGCVLLNTSISHAQTPPANLGCLEIHQDDIEGYYDLRRGKYVDFSSAGIPHYSGWNISPDRRYAVDLNPAERLLTFTTLSGLPVRTIRFPAPIVDRGYVHWSPDSRFIAVTVTFADKSSQLIIASPEKGIERQFDIHEPIGDTVLSMYWSPDSRFIAVGVNQKYIKPKISALYTIALNLYGLNGTVIEHIADNALGSISCGEICDIQSPYIWSGDGQSILYVKSTAASNETYVAMAYRLSGGRNAILATNLLDFPKYDKEVKHALITWKQSTSTVIALLDTTNGRILILEHATDPFDLQWIGDRALLRFSNAFMWINSDGTGEHHALVYGRMDVSANWFAPVNWSPDGRWLLINVVESDSLDSTQEIYTLWVVNLVSAEIRTFKYFSVPYINTISPDSQVAVVLLNRFDFYVLSFAENKLAKIEFDPERTYNTFTDPFIYQLVWLPDNKRFVMLYQTNYHVDLVTIDGKLLRQYRQFPELGSPMIYQAQWLDCSRMFDRF
jgi:hypothetical protein